MKQHYHIFGAAFTIGLLGVQGRASAQVVAGRGANDFSSIAANIVNSVADLPGLISGIAYLLGMLMSVLGIMKVKDHVENPTQTPLKDGAIRLASGGALFALPIISESMLNTIGTTNVHISPAELNRVQMGLRS